MVSTFPQDSIGCLRIIVQKIKCVVTVRDKRVGEISGPWTPVSKWDMHMYVGRGWRPFAGACVPLIPVSVSKGIQRAWRQPKEVRPLHILDALLQGLAINRVSMLHRLSSKHINFFRFEPKQTETPSVLVVFCFVSRNQKTFFFGLFRCFGPVSKQPKQTELYRNKPKKLQKTFSIRGSSKKLTNFFSVFAKPIKGFLLCFGVPDRYRNNRNKQNCMVWGYGVHAGAKEWV